MDPGVPVLRERGLEVGFQPILILPKASGISGARSMRATLFHFQHGDVLSLAAPQPHSSPFVFLNLPSSSLSPCLRAGSLFPAENDLFSSVTLPDQPR